MPCDGDLLTIALMDSPATPSLHLSAAIVVHNNALAQLRVTLVTLRGAVDAAVQSGELRSAMIYIVDNASEESYQAGVERLLDELTWDDGCAVTYMRQSTNAGFGVGQNAALSESHGDFHLILNPDVELAPDALSVGLSCLHNAPQVVALSPRVTGPSGQREFLCKRYPSLLVLALRAYAPAFVQQWFSARLARYDMRNECGNDAVIDVEIISGCYMLCRTADLRAIDGFDEGFFLYFEDFDLSLRLRQRGKLRYQPAMRIVHHGGYTANKGWRHLGWFVRSGLRFFNLHGWRFV